MNLCIVHMADPYKHYIQQLIHSATTNLYTSSLYFLLAAPRLDFFSLIFFFECLCVHARNLHTIFLLIKQRILNECFACMLRRIKNDPTTTTFSSLPIIYSLTFLFHSMLLRFLLLLLLSISMFKIRSTTHESPACMLIFMAPPLWLCYLLWCIYQVKPRLINLQSSLIFIDLSLSTSVLNKLLTTASVCEWVSLKSGYLNYAKWTTARVEIINFFFVNDQAMLLWVKNTFPWYDKQLVMRITGARSLLF